MELKSKEAVCLDDMFFGCCNLKTIEFPTNQKIKAKTVNNMFYNCKCLKKVNSEDINFDEITSAKCMIHNSNIDYFKFPKMTASNDLLKSKLKVSR